MVAEAAMAKMAVTVTMDRLAEILPSLIRQRPRPLFTCSSPLASPAMAAPAVVAAMAAAVAQADQEILPEATVQAASMVIPEEMGQTADREK
jgi:hypothetical protein